MRSCDWLVRTSAHTLGINARNEVQAHITKCLLCQLRVKFVKAVLKTFSQITLRELIERCVSFEQNCIVDDTLNKRLVVKQNLCFCGLLAQPVPLPLRDELEQRANLECESCKVSWRVAHCRTGCGAPLDDRFDELCSTCGWIKCPRGHCSNDECLEAEVGYQHI